MRIVLAHGVFDLLHAGHVHHLKTAKRLGDFLIVSVVPDEYVTKRKPIYSEQERVALLNALRCVDLAVLCEAPGPEKVISDWKPSIYIRGSDYEGKEMPESALLKALGIPTVLLRSIPPRTSDILERIRNA